MKEFTEQHECDLTTLSIRAADHDCDIQMLSSDLYLLKDNVDKISSEFEMYKFESKMINELFLSTLCLSTFKTMVDNIKNDIYMYDTTHKIKNSIEYVINNIINAYRHSSVASMNMYNIVDWALLVIDESTEDYNLIDYLTVIFKKDTNAYFITRETDYKQLSNIIRKHVSIEKIADLIHENQKLGDYIISRIDTKNFESLVDYTFHQCSPNSVKRLWSKMPDNDAYRDLYGERLYKVVCDNSNRHYETVTSDALFIKRVREKVRRVDNYYKLLNRD